MWSLRTCRKQPLAWEVATILFSKPVKKLRFEQFVDMEAVVLPRQARDKHIGKTQKQTGVSLGVAAVVTADGMATPVSKEQAGLHANMRRGQLPQSPEYAGKAVIRRVAGKEAVLFPLLMLKMDAFTKTGSGQTQGKPLNTTRFAYSCD